MVKINKHRILQLTNYEINLSSESFVVYWMRREIRSEYNWALQYAANFSTKYNCKLIVIFNLLSSSKFENVRECDQFKFMILGLMEVEIELRNKNIEFVLTFDDPLDFLQSIDIGFLITDFSPLRISTKWNNDILPFINKLKIPFHIVDAHNIFPCWEISKKTEYAAVHLRNKMYKRIDEFLWDDKLVKLSYYRNDKLQFKKTDWNAVFERLNFTEQTKNIYFVPGQKEAKSMLKLFLKHKFSKFAGNRNDANANCNTNLSPYLHFGFICSQYVIVEADKYCRKFAIDVENFNVLFEEMVVRRELSDNFCYYNENYDNFDGLPDWAKKTLDDHRKDKREHIYSLEELEKAQTADCLWNACQNEMIVCGKLHGFLRMFWAKRILEWCETPEKSLEISIHLHNKYSLDARDPNNYAQNLWVLGLHDRPYKERPIIGKVRPLTINACKKHFNVQEYIDRIENL